MTSACNPSTAFYGPLRTGISSVCLVVFVLLFIIYCIGLYYVNLKVVFPNKDYRSLLRRWLFYFHGTIFLWLLANLVSLLMIVSINDDTSNWNLCPVIAINKLETCFSTLSMICFTGHWFSILLDNKMAFYLKFSKILCCSASFCTLLITCLNIYFALEDCSDSSDMLGWLGRTVFGMTYFLNGAVTCLVACLLYTLQRFYQPVLSDTNISKNYFTNDTVPGIIRLLRTSLIACIALYVLRVIGGIILYNVPSKENDGKCPYHSVSLGYFGTVLFELIVNVYLYVFTVRADRVVWTWSENRDRVNKEIEIQSSTLEKPLLSDNPVLIVEQCQNESLQIKRNKETLGSWYATCTKNKHKDEPSLGNWCSSKTNFSLICDHDVTDMSAFVYIHADTSFLNSSNKDVLKVTVSYGLTEIELRSEALLACREGSTEGVDGFLLLPCLRLFSCQCMVEINSKIDTTTNCTNTNIRNLILNKDEQQHSLKFTLELKKQHEDWRWLGEAPYIFNTKDLNKSVPIFVDKHIINIMLTNPRQTLLNGPFNNIQAVVRSLLFPSLPDSIAGDSSSFYNEDNDRDDTFFSVYSRASIHEFRAAKLVHVYDQMLESPYFYSVPLAFVKYFMEEELRRMLMFPKEILDDVLQLGSLSRGYLSFLKFIKVEIHQSMNAAKARILCEAYDYALKKFSKRYEGILEILSNGTRKQILYENLTFRPSVCKESFNMQFMPINLHIQHLHISGEKKDYFMLTHGAFAAHIFGFDENGIYFMRKKAKDQEKLNEESINNACWLEWKVKLSFRLGNVLSQLFTAIATSFMIFIHNNNRPSASFLYQIESFLSTVRKEYGMLSDMFGAVIAIQNNLNIKVISDDDVNNIKISSSDAKDTFKIDDIFNKNYTITIPVSKLRYDELYGKMDSYSTVKVTVVMFTQGINEEQKFLSFSNTQFQDEINNFSVETLKSYVFENSFNTNEKEVLLESCKCLQLCIKEKKGLEILKFAAGLVRRLNGARSICCKSGKDRTSMGVTFDYSNILKDLNLLNDSSLDFVLDVFRGLGSRRENPQKNTGKRKYAFNALQRRFLPILFRPPQQTCASGCQS